jgi:hypothetical protein
VLVHSGLCLCTCEQPLYSNPGDTVRLSLKKKKKKKPGPPHVPHVMCSHTSRSAGRDGCQGAQAQGQRWTWEWISGLEPSGQWFPFPLPVTCETVLAICGPFSERTLAHPPLSTGPRAAESKTLGGGGFPTSASSSKPEHSAYKVVISSRKKLDIHTQNGTARQRGLSRPSGSWVPKVGYEP